MIKTVVINSESLGNLSNVAKGSKQRGVLDIEVTRDEIMRYNTAVRSVKKPIEEDDEYETSPSVIQKYYGKNWRLIDMDDVEHLIGGVYPVLWGQTYCTNDSYNRGITMMAFHSVNQTTQVSFYNKAVVSSFTLDPSDNKTHEAFVLYESATNNLEEGIAQKRFLGSGSGPDPVYVYIG